MVKGYQGIQQRPNKLKETKLILCLIVRQGTCTSEEIHRGDTEGNVLLKGYNDGCHN